jgi:hypothetical protein
MKKNAARDKTLKWKKRRLEITLNGKTADQAKDRMELAWNGSIVDSKKLSIYM